LRIIIYQRAANRRRDTSGNIGSAAATITAAASGFYHLGRKKHGVYDLDDAHGNVAGTVVEISKIAGTDVGTAAIDRDVTNASVENDAFFRYRNALKLLIAANADASLKRYLDIKANGDLIKAAVELYGLNANVGPKDRSGFRPHRIRTSDDLLTEVAKINAYVLVAIPITAGIQYAKGIDTDGFPICGISARNGRTSIIRHLVIPL
jgi:hypothetical protein